MYRSHNDTGLFQEKQVTIRMVKKNYKSPSVLETVDVLICTDFLTGSVADSMAVQTDGQETGGFYDASTTVDMSGTFNFSWGVDDYD